MSPDPAFHSFLNTPTHSPPLCFEVDHDSFIPLHILDLSRLLFQVMFGYFRLSQDTMVLLNQDKWQLSS